MRIFLNSPFDPLPLEGGRPMRYELLAKALTELGHDVVWWSSDFHHLRKRRRKLKRVYRHDGYEVRLVPTLPYQSNVSMRRLRSHREYGLVWREMAIGCVESGELEPPDVIVVSMPPLGLFDQAARLRHDYGCGIVVDVQDAWPENFFQLAPRWCRRLMGLMLLRFKILAAEAYCGADAITAVAEKYLRLAQNYGAICPSKVFPLGALLPDTPPRRRARDRERLRLIYVGNLGPSYDLKTMLKAIRELVDEGCEVSLDVAGDGPCRDEVEDAVRDAGESVCFHGYLSGDALSELMRECDVGVIPMRDEMLVAVPNKLVDYATHGLAVVNGLDSESRELLAKYDCGFYYEIGSVESFKCAVMRYYADRELLLGHQRNARGMAEEIFDASRISEEMARWIGRRARCAGV